MRSGIMTRKKIKRVNVRGPINGHQAARWHRFFDSGAVESLLLLAAFVILSSFILVFEGSQTFRDFVRGDGSFYSSFLLMIALMLILSAALGLYIWAFQPRIVKNHLRGGVLLATMLIMIISIRAGIVYQWSPYLIVVPVMLVAIMMTIAYSQRFALGCAGFLLLVSVLALNEDAEKAPHGIAVLLSSGAAMGFAVLLLKEIRTRTRLIEVCLLAALVMFVMVWLVGLWLRFDISEILVNSFAAFGGTVAVGFIMQGFLPFIERLFRTATSLTLLDWSEATKPLLKRLAVEAPGTFNHSLQIGMLAEAAAESIGANGLLCRVGSYYHDVGKLNKPRYFVENQAERINQHKELSPTMSRMIIVGHVRDGLELAREYKVPRLLHQFIETHHGKTLVEYFYHEASKREGEAGRTISESEFRYPGPKPTSKEAAIVMLTDAVESATRSVQDPTPNRIENVVFNVGMRRLQDGQFDNCDLTMRELRRIENSLVKSLCAMYHSRIAYPKRDKDDKLPAEAG
jgi:cyclic-di-AMP phosphodiesterase PgpH